MKTVVIYYSWSGYTEAIAKARADTEQAHLYEIMDKHKPGKLRAYTAGCFAALRMKRTATTPLKAPLEQYDRVIILAPVWAGHPAPAINTVFDALPPGKEVVVGLVSASGNSSCKDKVAALVEGKGCTLAGFENIKG